MYKIDIVDALHALVTYQTDNRIIAGDAMEEIKKLRTDSGVKDKWIAELMSAVFDLMDGQAWYDIQAQTGLSEKKCKQLIEVFNKCASNGEVR